jgi:hypothetical protein
LSFLRFHPSDNILRNLQHKQRLLHGFLGTPGTNDDAMFSQIVPNFDIEYHKISASQTATAMNRTKTVQLIDTFTEMNSKPAVTTDLSVSRRRALPEFCMQD